MLLTRKKLCGKSSKATGRGGLASSTHNWWTVRMAGPPRLLWVPVVSCCSYNKLSQAQWLKRHKRVLFECWGQKPVATVSGAGSPGSPGLRVHPSSSFWMLPSPWPMVTPSSGKAHQPTSVSLASPPAKPDPPPPSERPMWKSGQLGTGPISRSLT